MFGEVYGEIEVLEGEVEGRMGETFGSCVEFVNVDEGEEDGIGIDEWLGELISSKGALFELLQGRGNCCARSDKGVEELGMKVSGLYGKIYS